MRVVSASIAALILSFAAPASAQEIGNAEEGHAFARTICVVCHGVEADSTTSPHRSAPTFRRIAAEPGMTAMALAVVLQNPHREMPDLILKRDDMANVIAYILSLQN